MAPPLITLKDIRLTFGGTPLLEGAELTVAAGDRICLVGRNGSGKSTLLKIAAGFVEPDRGERFAHPGASIRYLRQEADFTGFATVRAYVEAGGLMSYGANFPDLWRRAAEYVDKILRGAKPADLPVEQPTKFDLVINMTTAKALGLNIPDKLLAVAAEVIE